MGSLMPVEVHACAQGALSWREAPGLALRSNIVVGNAAQIWGAILSRFSSVVNSAHGANEGLAKLAALSRWLEELVLSAVVFCRNESGVKWLAGEMVSRGVGTWRLCKSCPDAPSRLFAAKN